MITKNETSFRCVARVIQLKKTIFYQGKKSERPKDIADFFPKRLRKNNFIFTL